MPSKTQYTCSRGMRVTKKVLNSVLQGVENSIAQLRFSKSTLFDESLAMSELVNKIGEKLTQTQIEDGINAVFREPYPQRPPLRELIPEELLIKAKPELQKFNIKSAISKKAVEKVTFLIYGTEVLRQEPMLVEFEFHDTCSVVGDLHGNINDLIGVMYEAGLPPRSKFLFLGDYVGRGDCQLEVFLAVLLLKLRWPTYVYMLRGNHECIDQSEDDGFEKACMDAYNDELILKLFSQLFDYMPVAAIVNNQVLCCHGGVSQWMISRDAIRQIPRPTKLKNMKILENCLLTDILWADPDADQIIPFLPSPRGVSYTFNEEALREVFFHLRCNILIRGHKWVEGGILEEFKDMCYTVHTTSLLDLPLAPAFITLKLELRKVDQHQKVIVDTTRNTMHSFSADYSDSIWTEILASLFLPAFTKNPTTYLDGLNHRKILEFLDVPEQEQRRNISHVQMTQWTLRFAAEIFRIVRENQSNIKGVLSAEAFPRYFPTIYDIMYAKGHSFRVRLSAEEKEIIKKVLNMEVVPSNPLPLENWIPESYEIEEGSETFTQDRQPAYNEL